MDIINQIESELPSISINDKINRLSSYIEEVHPELHKFLEEMPITIPFEKNTHITHSLLESYYESLKLLLQETAKKDNTFTIFPDEIHT